MRQLWKILSLLLCLQASTIFAISAPRMEITKYPNHVCLFLFVIHPDHSSAAAYSGNIRVISQPMVINPFGGIGVEFDCQWGCNNVSFFKDSLRTAPLGMDTMFVEFESYNQSFTVEVVWYDQVHQILGRDTAALICLSNEQPPCFTVPASELRVWPATRTGGTPATVVSGVFTNDHYPCLYSSAKVAPSTPADLLLEPPTFSFTEMRPAEIRKFEITASSPSLKPGTQGEFAMTLVNTDANCQCSGLVKFTVPERPNSTIVIQNGVAEGAQLGNGQPGYRYTFNLQNNSGCRGAMMTMALLAPSDITLQPASRTLSPALLPGETLKGVTAELSGAGAIPGAKVEMVVMIANAEQGLAERDTVSFILPGGATVGCLEFAGPSIWCRRGVNEKPIYHAGFSIKNLADFSAKQVALSTDHPGVVFEPSTITFAGPISYQTSGIVSDVKISGMNTPGMLPVFLQLCGELPCCRDTIELSIPECVVTSAPDNEQPEFSNPMLQLLSPSPAGEYVILRLRFPEAVSNARITISDAAGHQTAMPIDHASYPAGTHDVVVGTGNLPLGKWFFTLHAGNRTATEPVLIQRR